MIRRLLQALARLAAALAVIYLIFNEGYVATKGDAWIRVDLCEEALRLARVVAAGSTSKSRRDSQVSGGC